MKSLTNMEAKSRKLIIFILQNPKMIPGVGRALSMNVRLLFQVHKSYIYSNYGIYQLEMTAYL